MSQQLRVLIVLQFLAAGSCVRWLTTAHLSTTAPEDLTHSSGLQKHPPPNVAYTHTQRDTPIYINNNKYS